MSFLAGFAIGVIVGALLLFFILLIIYFASEHAKGKKQNLIQAYLKKQALNRGIHRVRKPRIKKRSWDLN